MTCCSDQQKRYRQEGYARCSGLWQGHGAVAPVAFLHLSLAFVKSPVSDLFSRYLISTSQPSYLEPVWYGCPTPTSGVLVPPHTVVTQAKSEVASVVAPCPVREAQGDVVLLSLSLLWTWEQLA